MAEYKFNTKNEIIRNSWGFEINLGKAIEHKPMAETRNHGESYCKIVGEIVQLTGTIFAMKTNPDGNSIMYYELEI